METMASDLVMTTTRLIAGFILLTLSSLGLIVNVYVFIGIVRSSRFQSHFYILCVNRTISNCVFCAVFLVWSAPSTIIGFFYLPNTFNVIFGHLMICSYVVGLIIQLEISSNLLCAAYFPGIKPELKYLLPGVLVFTWTIVFIGTLASFTYRYDIDRLLWIPEDSSFSETLMRFVFIISAITNVLNALTLGKLFHDKRKSYERNISRHKKLMKLLAQSCVQNLLYVIYIIITSYISPLCIEIWFRFLTLSVSWLFIHVFDGLVMIVFNKDLHSSNNSITHL